MREVVRVEEQLADAISSRGAAVTGFVGLILTLSGVASRGSVLNGVKGGQRDVVIVTYGLALLFLVLSAVLVLRWVLRPTAYPRIEIGEVERFREAVAVPKVVVDLAAAGDWLKLLTEHRHQNNDRTTWLRRGYTSLTLGIILVAVSVGTLVWHDSKF